jgi:hypothetical protein
MQNDYLLWIATAFYAAHILEEFAFDWRSWASKGINLPVNWQWFHIVNAAVVILGICCASIGWRLPEFSLIYPALMTINAVFFHILSSVILRRIFPGVITALVLFLPIVTAIYAAAAQDGVLTPRALCLHSWGNPDDGIPYFAAQGSSKRFSYIQTMMPLHESCQTPPFHSPLANYLLWQAWRDGAEYLTLPTTLPPLRMLLVMDNLAGHKSVPLVHWLWEHGVLPLYTPLSGSWLNMGESIQRLLKRRTLDGQTPITPEEIISWFEATASAWNSDPTPFVWNGKRKLRRTPAARHLLGGSGTSSSRSLVRASHH